MTLPVSLPPLLQGKFEVRRRSLIGCRESNGKEKLALNDLVVKSGTTGRLGRFSVFCGTDRVADYASDGIVFSTPTGSTAYNLAAGGPIAHPEAEVILMTPISAHSLTSRPLVFPSGINLRIEYEENTSCPACFRGWKGTVRDACQFSAGNFCFTQNLSPDGGSRAFSFSSPSK